MAEYAAPEVIIEPESLEALIEDPKLRIVDCDVADQYRRAHITGAVYFKGERFFKNPEEKRFIMSPEQFKEAMESLGIGDDSRVVAYDASGSLNAARMWWCLNYYGHSQVKVMNGGWNLWLEEGRSVTMAEPEIAAASFTPRVDEALLASAEYIIEAINNPDIVLLDVRSDGEWEGTNDRGNKRAGHMPGAVHIEWLNNITTDELRTLKSPQDLTTMFETAGVTSDKEIVTICQGGIRASQAAMTLKLLGYPRVRNYDGSFLDWGTREDTPLV